MREPKTDDKRKNPAKLALAVGLTVVFIIVVVTQVRTYSGDDSVAPRAADGRANRSRASKRPDSPQREVRDDIPAGVPWPAVDLAECIAHDPFAVPEGFVAKKAKPAEPTSSADDRKREIDLARERAARRKAISELMDVGVGAVVQGPDQSMAIVGSRTIRVGDVIHGHRVLAIEPKGIVLESIESK